MQLFCGIKIVKEAGNMTWWVKLAVFILWQVAQRLVDYVNRKGGRMSAVRCLHHLSLEDFTDTVLMEWTKY